MSSEKLTRQFAATHAIFTGHPGHPAWSTLERLPNGTFFFFLIAAPPPVHTGPGPTGAMFRAPFWRLLGSRAPKRSPEGSRNSPKGPPKSAPKWTSRNLPQRHPGTPVWPTPERPPNVTFSKIVLIAAPPPAHSDPGPTGSLFGAHFGPPT